ASEFETFSNEAADLLLEIGIIRQKPDLKTIVDTQFIR
ncbi:MAG TPA: ABC transporter permease, partial [Microvirga sp.]|nr:ABC transporter permease [Microvirga sp.]